MKHWELIADNLHDAGCNLGWVAAERRSLRRRVQDVLHFQVPQLAHAA